MFCGILNEEETFQAYILYASLHGLTTDEASVRRRIEAYYRRNVPDETIDDAICAFADDNIIAPPDIVIGQWGKSRVYELLELPCGGWRHQVSEAWFQAGCSFSEGVNVRLAHFWTRFDSERIELIGRAKLGMRLQLEMTNNGRVRVLHRSLGQLGNLPPSLAAEIEARKSQNIRYLGLLDAVIERGDRVEFRVLVTLAAEGVLTSEIIQHAALAFTAERNKC